MMIYRCNHTVKDEACETDRERERENERDKERERDSAKKGSAKDKHIHTHTHTHTYTENATNTRGTYNSSEGTVQSMNIRHGMQRLHSERTSMEANGWVSLCMTGTCRPTAEKVINDGGLI
jgi:hypothetical protein